MIEVFAKFTPIAIFNKSENFDSRLIELNSTKQAIENFMILSILFRNH